jgi:endonuclease YncB( thermonuclease family)
LAPTAAASTAVAPATTEQVRPGRAARVLSRRPDLTLTRIAIVVLAALLGFSAIANMARSSSSSTSSPATSPQSGVGSPLVEESAGGASPSSEAEAAFRPTGATEFAVVTSITDGDTIKVEIDGQEYPLRYIGTDSPEPDATDPAIKRLADAATAANAGIVEGKEVYLEREVSDTDRFGRLLRDVWIVDSGGSYVLVNLDLVRLGYAQLSTFPPDVRYVRELTEAQAAAQSEGIGIWGLDQPVSPEVPGAESQAPAASTSPAAAEATPQNLVGGGAGGAGAKCHPSYDPCLPVVDDLDCAEVRALGAAPVSVKGPDDYMLDAEEDGLGCESNE